MADFLSKITAPVPGDNPFGADIRHDPDYERLKGEMGKLGDIDVGLVESLSLGILSRKSKDVRAMAFLAYAALRKGDIGRLADIFGALAGYCQDSFEQVYPTREGAKLAALRWLSEARFTSLCPKTGVSEGDAGHVARLKDALSKLRPALEKRFSSGGAPFPLLLYKRALEWEKAVEGMRAQGDGGDGSEAGGQPADSSADKPANQPSGGTDIRKSPDKGVSGGDAGGDPSQIITVRLSRGEYQEILHCMGKMETLLKKFA